MKEEEVRKRMEQVLELVISDVATLRSSRANPSIIQDLVVPVYGGSQKMKIIELATVSAPDAQTLIIEPWDKSIIGEIRKGILAANVGLNPVISSGGEGEIIRISLAPLTTEDREQYAKLLSTKLENGKIMIRQIRSDFMRQIKKAFEEKEVSEDEKFSQEKKLQEITDDFNGEIEAVGMKKRQELLQI